MSDKNRKIDIQELKDPVVFVALGLGSGLSPKAPGTAGYFIGCTAGVFFTTTSADRLCSCDIVRVADRFLGMWLCC